MKKSVCALLFGLCLISISACGNNLTNNETDNVQDSSQQEEATSENENEEKNKDNTVEIENRDSEEHKDNTNSEEKIEAGFDELDEVVSSDIENTVSNIRSEYENLLEDIDTYEKYLKNTDKVEMFYDQVYEETQLLCIRMREYSLDYAKEIIASDESSSDKYEEFDELYDCIYDDGGEDIFDEIYDGVLDDIFDEIYDGILDDAYDDVASYDEWSDARSNEYDLWSDTRSDVYDEWSDFRTDVYDFWSDIKGELWDDDMERAEDKIADFQEDIEKLKGKNIQNETQASNEETENNSTSKDMEGQDAGEDEELVDGVHPEFKEAMDSYEAFMDDYVAYMKKYNENPSDMQLLNDYVTYMNKYADFVADFEKWNSEELNAAEKAYYIEVQTRVSKILLEAAQ